MAVKAGSSGHTQERHVVVSRLVDGGDGESRFEDDVISYTKTLGPLRQTAAIPAMAISFHWRPAGYTSDFRPMPGRRIVLVTQGAAEVLAGNGEARMFRPGDVLEALDCEGRGHVIRAIEDQPFRAAIIALDDKMGSTAGTSARRQSTQSLPFVRNATGDDGQSHFDDGALTYFHGDNGALFTEEIAITAYQFVLALADLSFDFHNAPQRQTVLPLTGGIDVENGDGSRRQVRSGGVFFGEDTTGQGHITRAVDGALRFSIFAHLS